MTTTATPAKLPGSLAQNPRLSRWLRIDAAGFVEVSPGKVEIGQGILTALAQITADELGLAVDQVRLRPASTAVSPDEGVTAGSLSVQDCGTALRYAAAETRALYLAAAADKLGVPASALRVEGGRILGPGNLATSYWELADISLLDRDATASAAPLAPDARTLAGHRLDRIDIPDKVYGRPRLIHDVIAPGTLHGRVLRPARPGARLASIDTSKVTALPGILAIVCDGSFVGVVAEDELAAVRAVETLAKFAVWDGGNTLPGAEPLETWLKRLPAETTVVDETGTPAPAARTIRRTFTKPYLAHASIGPSCAVARWDEGSVAVKTHSQGIYNLRHDLAIALGLPQDRIVCEHGEGAGCYGHNGADDVALDACLLARAVPGRTVRVVWSRAEELAWSPAQPGMTVELEAGLDDAGRIVSWRHEIWSNGHSSRPGRNKIPAMLAASHIANGFPPLVSQGLPLAAGGGADRNAVPPYAFPARKIVSHRLTVMPLRTSAMRGLGAFCNVFAVESLLDEIAAAQGADPLALRLALLPDPRARAVLERAAERAGWSSWSAAEGRGHGLAYARYKNTGAYCAVVAEVEVEAALAVKRLVVAVDVGEVVNPDGVANQIEGGAIQATSWTLKEEIRTERDRVLTDSWEAYPILRFSEVPEVVVEIIDRPTEKPLGAGEAAQGPVAGAIANALYDALKVRVRDMPLTQDRIVAAMM